MELERLKKDKEAADKAASKDREELCKLKKDMEAVDKARAQIGGLMQALRTLSPELPEEGPTSEGAKLS